MSLIAAGPVIHESQMESIIDSYIQKKASK